MPAEIAAADCFHEVLSVADEDAGLSLLAELHEQGNLSHTLLVSARERSTSWARNAGLAVLIPAQGDAIARGDRGLDRGKLYQQGAAPLAQKHRGDWNSAAPGSKHPSCESKKPPH